MKNRLVIYFHYHPAGLLDSACRLVLQAMRGQAARLYLVHNGTLQAESRRWAQAAGLCVRERPNRGYDVGAYRQMLLTLGRAGLADCDELVLMNHTLAGPVRPLAGMFAAMEARPELDFWGLTRHYAMQGRRFGRVPQHLQSHFLALRPRLLNSEAFWQYWRAMPLPDSYEQAVRCHEVRFTAWFAARGFRWDSYVDTADLAAAFVHPLMACPRTLIEQRGCPFFKRRSFFTPYADELRRGDGTAASELYAWLRTATDYPVDALLRDLLPWYPLSDIANDLHWTFPAPPDEAWPEDGSFWLWPLPPGGDAVGDWYAGRGVTPGAAVAFLRQNPLFGVAGPALPLWPAAHRAKQQRWQAERTEVAARLRDLDSRVPLNGTPPPLPGAGWLVLRAAAFPAGLPRAAQDQAESAAWLPPLLAQKNGYASAALLAPAQASAAADLLAHRYAAEDRPAEWARQGARLLRRRLQRER